MFVGERGDIIVKYSAKEKLLNTHIRQWPLDNSNYLTLTNAKGHDLMDQWQVVTKGFICNLLIILVLSN